MPFEQSFLAKLKKRRAPQEQFQCPDVDDILENARQLVRSGHKSLTPKAQAAYMSFVAYYLEYADRTVSGPEIAAAADSFCQGIGLIPEALPADMEEQLQNRPKKLSHRRRRKPSQT